MRPRPAGYWPKLFGLPEESADAKQQPSEMKEQTPEDFLAGLKQFASRPDIAGKVLTLSENVKISTYQEWVDDIFDQQPVMSSDNNLRIETRFPSAAEIEAMTDGEGKVDEKIKKLMNGIGAKIQHYLFEFLKNPSLQPAQLEPLNILLALNFKPYKQLDEALYRQIKAVKGKVLFMAAEAGNVDILAQFINNKTYLYGYNGQGQTPLMLAAKNGHFRVVDLLLTLPGIDAREKDHEGNSAWHLAYDNHHYAAADLIQNHIRNNQCTIL